VDVIADVEGYCRSLLGSTVAPGAWRSRRNFMGWKVYWTSVMCCVL